jgi:hypothetical protein
MDVPTRMAPDAPVAPAGHLDDQRRLPAPPVLAAAAIATLAIVVGVALVLTGGQPAGPPTVLTHLLLVDVAPERLAATPDGADKVWYTDGRSLASLSGYAEWAAVGRTHDDAPLDAAGAVALAAAPWELFIAYRDGEVAHWDVLDDEVVTVRVPAPDGGAILAPVIAADWRSAFVFPVEADGRTETMVVVDLEAEATSTVALPFAGTVRDATVAFGTVFVALDEGLVAVGAGRLDSAGVPACWEVLGSWGLSASALTQAIWPEGGLRLLALDPTATTITVFDPDGSVDADCSRVVSAPAALGSVDVAAVAGRPLEVGVSLAAVEEVAYVLTSDGLVLVDVADPDVARADRHRGTISGLEGGSGSSDRLVVVQAVATEPARVLVAGPAERVFWVIGPGEVDTPVATIDLRRGPP